MGSVSNSRPGPWLSAFGEVVKVSEESRGSRSVETEVSPREMSIVPPPLLTTTFMTLRKLAASSTCPSTTSASLDALRLCKMDPSKLILIQSGEGNLVFPQLNCFCLLCCHKNKSQRSKEVIQRLSFCRILLEKRGQS